MQAKIFNTLAAEYLCSVTYVYFKNIFGLKDLDIYFLWVNWGEKKGRSETYDGILSQKSWQVLSWLPLAWICNLKQDRWVWFPAYFGLIHGFFFFFFLVHVCLKYTHFHYMYLLKQHKVAYSNFSICIVLLTCDISNRLLLDRCRSTICLMCVFP